jgi:hypothetical protein
MAPEDKDGATTMESVRASQFSSSASDEDESASTGFSKKGTRRLLRKMDFSLIPFLALLYL